MTSDTAVRGPLLALDTTGDRASVALLPAAGSGAPARLLEGPSGRRAGQALHGLLRDALADGGVRPAELGLVVAVRGPGSFTGLRVGLAAAAGLGRGARVPVAGLGTTRCVALAAGRSGRVLVLLEAGHGRVFVAEHDVGPEGRERLVSRVRDASGEEAAERARDVVAAGGTVALRGAVPGAEGLKALGALAVTGPLAAVAARLAAIGADALEPLEPVYARAPSIRPPPARRPAGAA